MASPIVQENLSPSQRAAVMHDNGPAAVYAGPGSGKTRVVTLRAARLAQCGQRLLVTTFTNDATEEMKARLALTAAPDGSGTALVATMHALCLQILRGQGVKFALLTDEFLRRNLAETAQAAELEGGVAGFLSATSYQKNLGVTAATYKPDTSSEDRDFARAWRAYEKAKNEKGLREFDDLILDTVALLEGDKTARQTWAGRFTHIIVDECQDMNAPQFAVAFALGRDHKNVMLVGDLDQSLYAFRGADPRTFTHFANHPSTKVYELRENYRCTEAILQFADSLIRQDTERRALAFLCTRPGGEAVTWQRYADPDAEALAVATQILQRMQGGARPSEMAVLYRTNAQSEAFERHFAALGIPYAIREDGDFYARREVQGLLAYLNFFADPNDPALTPAANKAAGATGKAKRAKKQVTALDADPALPAPSILAGRTAYPDEWLLALLNVPNRKLSRIVGAQLRNWAEVRGQRIWDVLPQFHADDMKTHRALRQLMQELRRIEERMPGVPHAGDAIRIMRAATDFDGWLRRDAGDDKDNDRIQNIQRMQAAAAHYPTIGGYLAAVQRVRDEAARRRSERARQRRERDEVTLGTGHSAKGLEWPYVFAVGWSEELLPHRKADDINEERRIAYVIATRARDRLAVSSPDSWNDAPVAPSRFLTGLNLAVPPPLPELASALPPARSESDAEPETVETLGGLFS